MTEETTKFLFTIFMVMASIVNNSNDKVILRGEEYVANY